MTFFPRASVSSSVSVLSLVNSLNFLRRFIFPLIASLATALQFISGKMSISFLSSSGTERVMLTICVVLKTFLR